MKTFLAVVVVAVLLGGWSAAASARHERTCQARGSQTILANGYARVFLSAHGIYFGCRYGGRPIRLGTGGVDYSLRNFRLVRERLAYAYVYCNRYQDERGCEARITMLNLRSRAKRSRRFLGTGGVGGLELGRRGSVGFLLPGIHEQFADNVTRVYALGPNGLTLLDSGDDIDADSLALGGSTLYWRKGGQVASASVG
jgi:hypothetical protein